MSFDFSRLITDRTDADYQRWLYLRNKGFANMSPAEQGEWLNDNMKGAYHYRDLNRVGEVLNYLHDRLNEAGYINYLTTFKAKTDWQSTSVPTAAQIQLYISYVGIIRDALSQFDTTPKTPAQTGGLNIDEANNIEKILIDVETLINNMLAARYYCNDVCAGEI